MFVVSLIFLAVSIVSGSASVWMLFVQNYEAAAILIIQGFFWVYLANTLSIPENV